MEDVSIAIPDGRYNPADIPTINSPIRMLNRSWLRPVAKKAIPDAIAENAIVFLCLIFDETNPEHNIEIKYPVADIKKKEPAWLAVRFISDSMVGSKGEIIIRMVKFRKKIDVKKNKGISCDRIVSSIGLSILLSGRL